MRARAVAGALVATAVVFGRALADGPGGPSATFNREVVRVLDRKCVACHDTGDAIPLVTYVDARPWARAIREEVLERRMPPWGAAHGVRPLAGDLTLTPLEIAAFVSWADNGFPRGDPKDLPPARPTAAGWPHGTPSFLLRVPPAASASRRLALRTEARGWLRGFDFRPARRGDARAAFLFEGGRWLGAWTPFQAMAAAPRGAAAALGRGPLLLELDGGSAGGELALYVSASRPEVELRSLHVPTDPAGGRRRGRVELAEGLTVWALRPWTERAQGGLEVKAVLPDGSAEPLLWITDLAGAWPTAYLLEEPLALPKGASLVVSAATGAAAGADVLALSAPAPRP